MIVRRDLQPGRGLRRMCVLRQITCGRCAVRLLGSEVFKTYYGPLLNAFAALEATAQSTLERHLKTLVRQFNRSGDNSMVVPSEYLEIGITRH
jgi:hypothetical protein